MEFARTTIKTISTFLLLALCIFNRRTEALSTTAATATIRKECDVFVRFSPLIGGPSFLPLHCEVMLLSPPGNMECNDSNDDGVQKINEKEGENNELVMHRFDFLPKEPTKPETLSSLLTLQSVPGFVRHRKMNIPSGSFVTSSLSFTDKKDDDNESLLSMEPSIERAIQAAYTSSTSYCNNDSLRRGFTFRLSQKIVLTNPAAESSLFSHTLNDTTTSASSSSSNALLSAAHSYSQIYQSQHGQLHLLSNSCLNYAFGLIQCLNRSCQAQ